MELVDQPSSLRFNLVRVCFKTNDAVNPTLQASRPNLIPARERRVTRQVPRTATARYEH